MRVLLDELGPDGAEVCPTASASTGADFPARCRRRLDLIDRGQLRRFLMLLMLLALVLFEQDLADGHDFGLRAEVLADVA